MGPIKGPSRDDNRPPPDSFAEGVGDAAAEVSSATVEEAGTITSGSPALVPTNGMLISLSVAAAGVVDAGATVEEAGTIISGSPALVPISGTLTRVSEAAAEGVG